MVSESSQALLRKAESWGKQYNISAKESLSILSNIGLGINTPVLKMGGDRQKATGVSQDELINSAKQFNKETGFSQTYQEHVTGLRNESVTNHDEVGQRFAHTLGQMHEKSQQHQKQIEKHTQRSQHLSKVAEDLEQKSVVWNQKLTQEFVDDLAHEKMANGSVRGRQSAAHLIRYSPYERDIAAERFLRTKESELMSGRSLPAAFEKSRDTEMAKPLPKMTPPSMAKIPTSLQEIRKQIDAHEQRLDKMKIDNPHVERALKQEKIEMVKQVDGVTGPNLAKNSSALLGKIIPKKK